MPSEWLVMAVFGGVYLGMALGRWPGLAIDRTGVALIGAIILFVSGAVDARTVIESIDFPTVTVLFALMVISAQFAACGFFEWMGTRISRGRVSRRMLLFQVVVIGGILSAALTNDVVVWAMTPVLVHGLFRSGLNPRPYVIALACSANAGSAATVIGNPQNLLIGQYGGLDFWKFVTVCGVPAIAALAIVYAVIAYARNGVGSASPAAVDAPASVSDAPLKIEPLLKAVAATVTLVIVFSVAEERATWAIAISGALLLSRKMATRQMLSMVDWHILLLFAGLFVVTGALGKVAGTVPALAAAGTGGYLNSPEVLGLISLMCSNTIGNVPLVMFLLSVVREWSEVGLYSLAVFTTLSGNFLIVGSVANVIAVERAAALGVRIGFGDYARIGVPVTLLSLLAAYVWVRLAGPLIVGLFG